MQGFALTVASDIHLRSWNKSSQRVKKNRNELTVIGSPESTGERADNSMRLIGCLSEMTHVNIGVQSERALRKESWKFGEILGLGNSLQARFIKISGVKELSGNMCSTRNPSHNQYSNCALQHTKSSYTPHLFSSSQTICEETILFPYLL